MTGFATTAIHGDDRERERHGALRMPVYDGVAFEYETSRDIQLAFEGKRPAHSYTRITNPTIDDFEQRVRLLTGAHSVLALSSGMAAISNIILALGEAGSNIVTSRYLFGNTVSLFKRTLGAWGLETKFVDMIDAPAIEAAVDEKTVAVFLEIITNPQLEIADIKSVSEIAQEHTIPLILDGTLTTPYIFESRDYGVDIEIISSTKYISGGATSVGGLIIDYGTFDWRNCSKLKADAEKYGPFTLLRKLRREVYRNLGACLSPHNAYLQTLGLETLSMRIDKSCANALELARFLESHPKSGPVNYPGLVSSKHYQIAKKQFGDRFGSLLTFKLADRDACFRFMDRLKIIRRATNLNDNKTLIIHPASTIFCEYANEEKAAMDVGDSMVRVSVGIEDVDDIIDDLEQGFEGL